MTEENLDPRFQLIHEVLEKKRGLTRPHFIGKGSFGTVFKYVDSQQGREVCGKLVPAASVSAGERILWPTLDHDNVLKLHRILEVARTEVFITDLHKEDLSQAIATKEFAASPNSVFQMIKWTHQILSGLEYLHDVAKCVHLDLKLDNILVSSSKTAVVADFSGLTAVEKMLRPKPA